MIKKLLNHLATIILQKCFCEPLRLGVFAGAFLFIFAVSQKLAALDILPAPRTGRYVFQQ